MIVGVVVARRDRLASELEVTLDALRSEQDARAVQAVAEERNRIARELHDVVAHDVSVMVIQAGAARMVVADDPIAARQALGVVEDSGRDAIGELRRLMGVLRRDDDLVGAGAGLARVDALVARVRAAGIDTVLHIDTAIPALAPALDLVAYRVVQEALTNVVKHGGAGARAEVRIRSDNGAVAIEVQNAPGVRRDHGVAAAGGGHGLAGMRERVALYGGRLDVGSDATGAFCVRACLPATRTAPVEPVPRVPIVAPPMPAPDQLTARPDRRADVVIAVAWLALLEIEVAASAHRRGPLWANALAVGAMAIAAVWRRRAPLLFLLFVGAIAVVLGSGLTSMQYGTLTGTYTLVVPLFAVAAWSTRGRATIGLVAWLTGATAGAVLWHAPVGGWLGATVMGCVIWMVGRITRGQRSLTVRLRSASALLEAERDVREELAVTRERGRIARDLDALVSYDVVAMIVQAEAARALLDRHPDRAADAAHAVEQAGREALGRMRDVLGVLRADDAPALRSPVVSAGELDGALA
jgi:signal transduction histidine kinase